MVQAEIEDKAPGKERTRSEAFKDISLGIAGLISSVAIPIAGLVYSNDQSKREEKSQQSEAKLNRDAQSAEAERVRLAQAAEAQRNRDAQQADAERNRIAQSSESERSRASQFSQERMQISAQRTDKEKEISRSFVELGIKILSEKPLTPDDPVRQWALNIVNRYSEVKLTSAAETALTSGSFFAPGKMTETEYRDLERSGFIRGAAISHHNSNVNLSKLQANGLTFVYAKATQGVSGVDPTLAAIAAQSKAVGMPLGLYHFYMPNSDPIEQANNFLDVYRKSGATLAPVVDCEPFPGHAIPSGYANGVIRFVEYVARAIGEKPIVYTTQPFADEHLDKRFGMYPLFLAQFSANARLGRPKLPRWWTSYSMIHLAEGVKGDEELGTIDIVGFRGQLSNLMAK